MAANIHTTHTRKKGFAKITAKPFLCVCFENQQSGYFTTNFLPFWI